MSNEDKNYDVFISYSQKDEEQVNAIRKILEEKGFRCWFAPKDNRSGDLAENLSNAIKDCKAFMLVLSPFSQESAWVKKELTFAQAKKIRTFPVLFSEFEIKDSIEFHIGGDLKYTICLDNDENIKKLIADLNEYLKKDAPPEPVEEGVTTPQNETTTAVQIPVKQETPPKKKPWGWIAGGTAVLVLLVTLACVFFLGGGQGELTSGSYLIWNPAYDVGLSGLTSHEFYLAGHVVDDKRVMVRDYPSDCVWKVELFSDGTVTISQDGQNLGVIPGYTGVGLGGDHTADRWVLEDCGDGLYLIRNEELNVYLQWYAEKDNWSAYAHISDTNRDTFLIELRRAG